MRWKKPELPNWSARYLAKGSALLARLALPTGITARQLTSVSLIIGLVGLWLIALPSSLGFLLGALLLQVWYLIDRAATGPITGPPRTISLTGRFFNFLTHRFIEGATIYSIGLYSFLLTGIPLLAAWGFLASISVLFLNLLDAIKYKTFFETLTGEGTFKLGGPLSSPEIEAIPLKEIIRNIKGGRIKGVIPFKSLVKTAHSFLRKTCKTHPLINILTVSATLEATGKFPVDLRLALLLFYGVAIPLVVIIEIVYLTLHRKIDAEFHDHFVRAGLVVK